MSRTKKIAILAIIAMVLTLMPAALFAATADSDRLSGDTRIATALDIASAYWTTASAVVLAPADDANLVDALAAAPLAGQENAPILLTYKGSLDPSVKAKISALGATKVYAIGAISDAVAAEVDAITGVTVETLKGANRQSTAAAVNAKLSAPAGTFVVGYDAIPDALSVASYAAKNKYAIVLANPDGSVSATSLVGGTKYIVGGATLVADIAGVTRISGADRYATNSAVAEKLSFDYNRVYVANGVSLVDALAVAPLAAKYNAFVALASSSNVAAASVVNAKLTVASKVIAVGGTGAVADSVKGQVTYVNNALAVESVTALNAKEIKVVFNKLVDKISAETASYYTLGCSDSGTASSGVAEVKLQDDKKSVIVRLTGALANGDAYKLDVKNVLDTSYVKLTEEYKDTYKSFLDTAAPQVVSAEKRSTGKIRITFNEPVIATGATVTIDGVDRTSSLAASTQTGKYYLETADLTSTDAVKTGTHTVYVYNVTDAQRASAKKLSLGSATYVVGDDTAAPYVTSIFAKDSDTIAVVFSESGIQTLTDSNFEVKKGGYQFPDDRLSGYGLDSDDSSNKTYLVDIAASDSTNPLYGTDETSVTISVTVKGYKDSATLIGAQYNGGVVLSKDNAGPYVVSAGLNSATGSTLTIKFNETLSTADSSKITVIKSGVYKTVDSATVNSSDNKKLDVVLSEAVSDGTYNVTLDTGAVKDTANNKNAAATTAVEYKSTTGAALQPSSVVVSTSSPWNVITVAYGKKMKDSAIELANYQLDGVAFPTGTSIGFTNSDKDTVKITLASGNVPVTGPKMVTISKSVVADDGNIVMTSTEGTYSVVPTQSFVDDVKPELASAKITTTDGVSTAEYIVVKFNENLKSGMTMGDLANDFIVKIAGVKTTITAVSDPSAGNKELTLQVPAFNHSQTVTVEIAKSADVTLDVKDASANGGNVVKESTIVTATK